MIQLTENDRSRSCVGIVRTLNTWNIIALPIGRKRLNEALEMNETFDRMREELGEIRRRARTIEAGAVRGDELTQVAGQIAAATDRVVRLLEDAQRELRHSRRNDA